MRDFVPVRIVDEANGYGGKALHINVHIVSFYATFDHINYENK